MENGDSFCFAEDVELVAALIALDIQLLPHEGFLPLLEEGKRKTKWMLEPRSKSGEYLTYDLIKAYHTEGWFEQHPTHPFTYAVDAIRNLKTLREWENEAQSFETFLLGHERKLIVRVGSEKHQKCLARGLVPL